MCLAVPGKVIGLDDAAPLMKTGRVAFGPIVKVVNFAYLPDAVPGDYVLVHVGFAMSIIDQTAAENTVRRIISITSEPHSVNFANIDSVHASHFWSDI